MACPHGHNSNPESCSQCLGATPKLVARDEAGNLLVDGEVVQRGLPRAPSAYDIAAPRKRRSRCKCCRKLGHKTKDCREVN